MLARWLAVFAHAQPFANQSGEPIRVRHHALGCRHRFAAYSSSQGLGVKVEHVHSLLKAHVLLWRPLLLWF